jgi:hypothetical protein
LFKTTCRKHVVFFFCADAAPLPVQAATQQAAQALQKTPSRVMHGRQ